MCRRDHAEGHVGQFNVPQAVFLFPFQGNAGVALAVLALLIPAMLAWQSRKHNPQGNYRVAGGAPALALVFMCGIVVIAVQFSIAAGLLPEVG